MEEMPDDPTRYLIVMDRPHLVVARIGIGGQVTHIGDVDHVAHPVALPPRARFTVSAKA